MTMALGKRESPRQRDRQHGRGQGPGPRKGERNEAEQIVTDTHTQGAHTMKHGHVTGHKKERSGKGSNWWYQTPEAEAIIRKLEAEWEATQQQASK
jgi:hypothetical protein